MAAVITTVVTVVVKRPKITVPKTAFWLVELMKRYSKPEYQGSRLRRMVDLADRLPKRQARTTDPLPQTQRIDRRLSAETFAALVQAYRDGGSTPELRRRYGLSQGSVLKLLRQHGVRMRPSGTNQHQRYE